MTLSLVSSSEQSTNMLKVRSKPSNILEDSIERFLKYLKQYIYATAFNVTVTLCQQEHPDDVVLPPRGKQSQKG